MEHLPDDHRCGRKTSRPERYSGPSPKPRRFRLPVGLELIEGENYRQREGYDVVYLKDDDSPRYQYTIAASADRAGQVFRAMVGLLPEKVRALLEISGEAPPVERDGRDADDGREVCEVWMSGPVARGAVVGAFDAHRRVFVHDGMVGFGAVSAEGATEVFLDEHKLIYFYAREMEEADGALGRLGIPARTVVRHFSELSHVHMSLASKGAGEPYREVADELKRALGLEWEESKEYG